MLALQTPMPLTTKNAAPTKNGSPSPAPPILMPSLNVAAKRGEAANVPAMLTTASDEKRIVTSDGGTREVAYDCTAAEKPAERVKNRRARSC